MLLYNYKCKKFQYCKHQLLHSKILYCTETSSVEILNSHPYLPSPGWEEFYTQGRMNFHMFSGRMNFHMFGNNECLTQYISNWSQTSWCGVPAVLVVTAGLVVVTGQVLQCITLQFSALLCPVQYGIPYTRHQT